MGFVTVIWISCRINWWSGYSAIFKLRWPFRSKHISFIELVTVMRLNASYPVHQPTARPPAWQAYQCIERLLGHFFPNEQQSFVDLHIAQSNKTGGMFSECFQIMILFLCQQEILVDRFLSAACLLLRLNSWKSHEQHGPCDCNLVCPKQCRVSKANQKVQY